jgi:hypothetical protein
MTAFSRFSTGWTLPDLIRMAVLGKVHLGQAWQSHPPPLMRIRRATRAATIRACFSGASLVLAGARLLQSTGLLRSADAARAFHWSSRLTALAMRLWRQGRSRPRR